MSSLHDFVHNQLGEDPGRQDFETHIPIAPGTDELPVPPAEGTVPSNGRANRARAEGALKGDLYYSQQEAENTPDGRVESRRTVAEKVIEREIFPRG